LSEYTECTMRCRSFATSAWNTRLSAGLVGTNLIVNSHGGRFPAMLRRTTRWRERAADSRHWRPARRRCRPVSSVPEASNEGSMADHRPREARSCRQSISPAPRRRKRGLPSVLSGWRGRALPARYVEELSPASGDPATRNLLHELPVPCHVSKTGHRWDKRDTTPGKTKQMKTLDAGCPMSHQKKQRGVGGPLIGLPPGFVWPKKVFE
jgi:hypothetical protein